MNIFYYTYQLAHIMLSEVKVVDGKLLVCINGLGEFIIRIVDQWISMLQGRLTLHDIVNNRDFSFKMYDGMIHHTITDFDFVVVYVTSVPFTEDNAHHLIQQIRLQDEYLHGYVNVKGLHCALMPGGDNVWHRLGKEPDTWMPLRVAGKPGRVQYTSDGVITMWDDSHLRAIIPMSRDELAAIAEQADDRDARSQIERVKFLNKLRATNGGYSICPK